METRLELEIAAQPDDQTCGPTCLHAVYRYWGEDIALPEVVEGVSRLEGGGTIAVQLAIHALERGYRARIYTYNLVVFDPTWFERGVDLADKLRRQRVRKHDPKLHLATGEYLRFLELGGELRLEDLRPRLLRRYLRQGVPILTGLSSTYLYRSAREFGPDEVPDDIGGHSMGHFVVLAGYDRASRQVLVADPYRENPVSPDHFYTMPIDRVIGSILLGVLTYDANLLVIRPPRSAAPAGAPR